MKHERTKTKNVVHVIVFFSDFQLWHAQPTDDQWYENRKYVQYVLVPECLLLIYQEFNYFLLLRAIFFPRLSSIVQSNQKILGTLVQHP